MPEVSTRFNCNLYALGNKEYSKSEINYFFIDNINR